MAALIIRVKLRIFGLIPFLLAKMGQIKIGSSALVAILLILVVQTGCKSPSQQIKQADEAAYRIIEDKQKEALGKTSELRIERPSDIFRRRLFAGQNLPNTGAASLGTDKLEPIPHWPQVDLPVAHTSGDANVPIEPNRPTKLSLVDALQVGALNSPEYQTRKENVFKVALALDLERNNFRNIFTAQAQSQLDADTTGNETVSTLTNSADVGATRTLKNGAQLSAALAANLVNLLTQRRVSTTGLQADMSVTIPLLRGSGDYIVTEPLTQAERNVVYEMWNFERFKHTFAISIAQGYFDVLSEMDSVNNAEDNYRSSIQSARWSRRRADAGRIAEVAVDQAVQRELNSRNGWISSQERVKNRLDNFKTTLGLPTDAQIELDPNDLTELRARAAKLVEEIRTSMQYEAAVKAPPADAPVELMPPSREDAGPYEINEEAAIRLALRNRLDLRVTIGEVYDAQRQVVVLADALRGELTLGGSALFVDTDEDGHLRFNGGQYATLLTLDLPLERTKERNDFRNSLINLERAVRSVQTLEDSIKLNIRDELRALLESRESLKIQAQSVLVAEKRVRSVSLFLEAGRAQIRDLLEAQDALLGAQNLLTAAVVNYRIAELEIQQDMGVLQVDEKGLWRELPPEEIQNGTEE